MRIIRGKYGRRRFDVPANITARPTTDFARENIFNVLENIVDFDGKDALVARELGAGNFTLVRGDALRYVAASPTTFDIIFADPPYDMDGFAEIPGKILSSGLVKPGTIVIVEHNRKHDFSSLPGFREHRTYGSVNFSIFEV